MQQTAEDIGAAIGPDCGGGPGAASSVGCPMAVTTARVPYARSRELGPVSQVAPMDPAARGRRAWSLDGSPGARLVWRCRLLDVMAIVAIVAISMAVGGYLEGLRRDAAKASRGNVARSARLAEGMESGRYVYDPDEGLIEPSGEGDEDEDEE